LHSTGDRLERPAEDAIRRRKDRLAVIVGIGSTLFSQFTSGFGGDQPTIEDAMAMVLAALALLGALPDRLGQASKSAC
jgi:hypothetical protein